MNDATRCALVTGGSSGIGLAVAQMLARDGCDVGLFYRGETRDSESVVSQIEAHGRRAWVRTGDVRQGEQVRDAVESFVGQFGRIDILINNAGVFRDQVIWKMTDEQWQEVLDVDLTGMFYFARAVVPVMRSGGGGPWSTCPASTGCVASSARPTTRLPKPGSSASPRL